MRRTSHRRHSPAVPSPLRTLAAAWLAVSVLALCAAMAEAWLWLMAHPIMLLLVGMLVGALAALRMSRSAGPAPRIMSPAGPPAKPPRPPQPHKRSSRVEVVYWGKQRVGVLASRGRFVPDVRDRRA